MTSTSEAPRGNQFRTYDRESSVVFLKTNERFGGLSNMAPGFPLRVNGVRIRTSEALYQACRFPHLPDVQREIIDEHSPMTAKMRSKPFRKDSRPDWDAVRVKIMRWCLRVKLAQNWREFGRLLLATGDRPIVEQSRKDDFWGAKVAEDGSLVGMNVLGRLLMELREQLKGDAAEGLHAVEPLAIPEFLLFQRPIEMICAESSSSLPAEVEARPARPVAAPPPRDLPQPSLFDQPMIDKGQMDSQTTPAVVANSKKNPTRYADYRDSGLPWLASVPEHWEVRRSKYVFREVDKRSETGDETQLSMSQIHGLVESSKIDTWRLRSESYAGGKLCEAGDLVLNRLKAHLGVFAHASIPGVISPDYTVFRRVDDAEVRYFEHLYKSPIYKTELRKRTKGIVEGFWRLYSDDFYDLRVVVPPKDEQAKIVQFIDSYDRRVRRLIRNKRRLIGLLNEQKQTIIDRAVTRGLNPNAPMKPAGIDGMPEVPAHWEVRKLKQVASFNPSRTESSADFADGDEVVFLPMENVSATGEIDCSARGKVADLRSGYTYFKRHDVVVAKITPCFENGKGAYLGALETEIGFGTTEFVVLRASAEIDPRFLYQITMLRAFRRDGEMAMTGAAGQQRVPLNFMREFTFGLPDLQEQESILARVVSETNKINQTIEKTKAEISLVLEYRERLIADVVTGKLDVRQVEIAAPADEPIADADGALEEELEGDDAEVMEGADADD